MVRALPGGVAARGAWVRSPVVAGAVAAASLAAPDEPEAAVAGGCAAGLSGSPAPSAAWSRHQRLWWLAWASCPGLGWTRLQALHQAFPDLALAWTVSAERLAALPAWSPLLAGRVVAWRQRWGDDPLLTLPLLQRGGRRVLVPGDGRWSPDLTALERPPLALHWSGRGSLWPLLRGRQAVAVVGTRRPSSHGLTMAGRLGQALARAGWPVVSGLAEGIDGAVHRACLQADGAPVGVLGTPLERAYPRHHAALQEQVGQRGLLISEQPPGAAVQPGHFACRNRLQVVLARAVVVVECPLASGALHSASLAWQQEVPLWVVPADTDRASAQGSNRLLAQGATPLLAVDDLIRQLGQGPLVRSPALVAVTPACPSPGPRHPLLDAVGAGASLEQLALNLQRPPAALMPELLQLELEGWLQPEPGLRWRPRLH